MSDAQALLSDSVARALTERFDASALRKASRGEWLSAEWNALEEMGLPFAMVCERNGGFGLSMPEALSIVPIIGEFAVPLPVAETMLANWLLSEAGITPAQGPSGFAPVTQGPLPTLEKTASAWKLSGQLRRVPWARSLGSLCLLASHGTDCYVVRIDPRRGRLIPGRNLAGMPRDDIRFDSVEVKREDVATCPLPHGDETLLALGAVFRTLLIGGAVKRARSLTVLHANQRVQFGRPLGKFQVIQQNLAVLAEQAAMAVSAAAIAASQFSAHIDLSTAATVKIVAGEAAGIVAGIAHQVHGAIGFTDEHMLHFITQALWSWRDEFGTETTWSRMLGQEVIRGGAESYWPAITAALPSTSKAEALRRDVREFLVEAMVGRTADERAQSWMGWDPRFSRDIGARGWIGMTWPARYGGSDRSNAERYVVLEEMLAAGAPVCAHWVADRQSGPLLLKFGSEGQRGLLLPRIVAGDCAVCIGMSEPDSGSDLASVRTRAVPVDGAYRVNGSKLWTTNAHRSQFMILFCRTSGSPADRHQGMSQFLVDLSTPGITINPIVDAAGAGQFNEVVFENVLLAQECLIGQEGDGWSQVTGELALERSGPERFLSSMPLLVELIRALSKTVLDHPMIALGRLTARLMVIRQMSRHIADLIETGENPHIQAAIVKDIGNSFEQEIPEVARSLLDLEGTDDNSDLKDMLNYVTRAAPSFSLRGGTREILRGIIARDLGLR
jgi:alkylation response protein AidB-like acyl-CoA dehydrogenase